MVRGIVITEHSKSVYARRNGGFVHKNGCFYYKFTQLTQRTSTIRPAKIPSPNGKDRLYRHCSCTSFFLIFHIVQSEKRVHLKPRRLTVQAWSINSLFVPMPMYTTLHLNEANDLTRVKVSRRAVELADDEFKVMTYRQWHGTPTDKLHWKRSWTHLERHSTFRSYDKLRIIRHGNVILRVEKNSFLVRIDIIHMYSNTRPG